MDTPLFEIPDYLRELHHAALINAPDYAIHIRKLAEECNELAVNCLHFLDEKVSPKDVMEEMADVLVMLHRLLMMPMFRSHTVAFLYEKKLLRYLGGSK